MKQGNVREAALDVLLKIEKNQAYSNLLLNDTIKKTKLNQKDIPLLTELVYGTLQYKKTLDFYLKPFSKRPIEKLELWVLILLRLTLYQIVYLDRIPERAAVHEAVQIAKKRGHQGISGMVNGILRTIQRKGLPSFETIEDSEERLAVETSHPEWLIARWTDQFGKERTRLMSQANLKHPLHTARVNTVKTDRDTVIKSLQEEGIEAEPSSRVPDSIVVKKGSLSGTEAFRKGWLTIQDEGSMLVAFALAPAGGDRILDACAAPGGKSTHIAEKMNDEGEVVSLDIHKHKVGLIKEQKERLGLTIISPQVMDARKAHEFFEEEAFDKILVDAPCSGLGVIQRKPDLKWTKTPEDVARLSSIQKEILNEVWPLLKKGGRLVYSTCTVDKEENEAVIDSFVEAHKDASFDNGFSGRLPESFQQSAGAGEGKLQLFPGEHETDGFFISAVVKSDS
ncbi:16S rRNA (cytosine(967)-C(5))-methyltransferase RsmB [Evansella clarkii]|jgi:16S rRNA (cytosine967-C5)-methyltransferase|uniref:16S rRNA (cytosine(967)-C(5))-methyltransferase RsmB n=1 Tax=Evansella clarkii TaxID=79879 RepID=UPI000B431252|nr:16S rRNA (cytosine(967)-C(5))-methyltransferase RsmB [Evansella clarkii]